jgi:hypothetical protein
MGTNLFADDPPSESGASDFERGTSTAEFLGRKKKQAAPGPQPVTLSGNQVVTSKTDLYPRHAGFLYYVGEIQKNIRTDRIVAPDPANTSSKDYKRSRFSALRIAEILVGNFFDIKGVPSGLSSSQWVDPAGTLGRTQLRDLFLDAVTNPNGFPAASEPQTNPRGFRADSFDNWAGTHWGYFWSKYSFKPYLDTARWEAVREVPTELKGRDPDSVTRRDRVYDHQPVTWLEREAFQVTTKHDGRTHFSRHGWNQSHRDVPYIWGWDPKFFRARTISKPGSVGVTLGFPFLSPDGAIHFIAWFTPEEVFLEAVNRSVDPKTTGIDLDFRLTQQHHEKKQPLTVPPKEAVERLGYPKSSNSVDGQGQWVIEPLPEPGDFPDGSLPPAVA